VVIAAAISYAEIVAKARRWLRSRRELIRLQLPTSSGKLAKEAEVPSAYRGGASCSCALLVRPSADARGGYRPSPKEVCGTVMKR
jgi:hypothetical protein